MVHVMIRHKVADFGKWKQAFDAFLNKRMGAGETGSRVFQSVDDPRDVTLLYRLGEHRQRPPLYDVRLIFVARCRAPASPGLPT